MIIWPDYRNPNFHIPISNSNPLLCFGHFCFEIADYLGFRLPTAGRCFEFEVCLNTHLLQSKFNRDVPPLFHLRLIFGRGANRHCLSIGLQSFPTRISFDRGDDPIYGSTGQYPERQLDSASTFTLICGGLGLSRIFRLTRGPFIPNLRFSSCGFSWAFLPSHSEVLRSLSRFLYPLGKWNPLPLWKKG